jgi:hypothetical protein
MRKGKTKRMKENREKILPPPKKNNGAALQTDLYLGLYLKERHELHDYKTGYLTGLVFVSIPYF